jgi:Fe-S cluster assembly scaffold protein SufB
MPVRDDELREALRKPCPYGPDLDLSSYLTEGGSPESPGPEVSAVGIAPGGEGRAGSFLQVDHSALYAQIQKMYEDSLEILSFEEAMRRYDWLEEYVWKAVSPTADKYTAFTALRGKGGYFIRVLEGKEVVLPLQACLYLRTRNLLQAVHNLILMERDSSAQLLTGCLTHPQTDRGLHVGVSEFYLKRGVQAHLHHGPQLGAQGGCEAQDGGGDGGGEHLREQLRLPDPRGLPPGLPQGLDEGEEGLRRPQLHPLR